MIIAESLFQTIELVLSRESCPFTIHCNRTVMKQDSFKEHLDCDACMFFYSPFFLSKRVTPDRAVAAGVWFWAAVADDQ